MKKVLIVFGTRPEAIKMAPVIKEFRKFPEKFETLVCVTAQHRELLDQVLSIFEIEPDIDLNIMQSDQDLTDVTIRVLNGMRDVLGKVKPDLVLVHGDTTTSIAAALAAFYMQIPVGHVEAGLRTNNLYSPWPEEMNRQITDRISTFHFAPTEFNRKNLIREGIAVDRIFVTGNTVIDALFIAMDKLNNISVRSSVEADLFKSGVPANLYNKWDGKNGQRRMVLITGHRRENFGDGFHNICLAIYDLSVKHPGVDFVYPIHPNPKVRESINHVFGNNLNKRNANIFFIEPVKYLSFIWLMAKCYMVLTDSGGIQEEAPCMGKPVLVMRNDTERPEGIESGIVKLVGTTKDLIEVEVEHLLTDHEYYNGMAASVNPYGDGKASEKILTSIIYFLK